MKKIITKLCSNALFWIFIIMALLLLFVAVFDRYTPFGVDKVYNIF